MLRLIISSIMLLALALPHLRAAGLPLVEHRLANGLRLLVLERPGVPVVSCQVWYRVGSAHERPGETGLAHFLEHMMFKGTDRYRKGEIDKITQQLGGSNNATTFYDYTDYYFSFAADRWTTALEIEANRMKNCLFDAKEVESERQVVIEERQKDRDGPWGKLTEEVAAVTFQTHPYKHPVIGWLEDLEAVPRQAFVDFYKAYYNPNNATMVVVGAVDAADVKKRVEALFAKIPSQPLPVPLRRQEPPQECERRVVFREGANVPRGVISFRAPPRGAPESVPLDVAESVLGSGKTARLHQRLVEKEKLCSSISVDNEARKDHNLFQVYLELLPGSDPAKVEAIALEEIEKLRSELIKPEELARARSQVQASFVFDQETTQGLASKIGEWDTIASIALLNGYLTAVEKVDVKDVKAQAAKIFVASNRTVGWSLEGPAPAGKPGEAPDEKEDKEEGRGERTRGGAQRKARSAAPSPAPSASPTPAAKLDVTRFTLANGLRVLALPFRHLPVVAVNAFVEADERFDPEDKAGLAQFTGKMLEEGAGKRDHLQIAEAIENVGGAIDTGEDGFAGKALSKDLPLLLELAADCLARPAFPPERVEQIRTRILAEIAAGEDDPGEVAQKALKELVYEGHPFHHPVEGYAKTVKAIGVADLKAHHERFYAPGNTLLAIVGDFDPATIRAQVEAAFGSWPAKDVKLPELPKIERAKKGREKMIPMAREQVKLLLGHIGIKRDNPDYYALEVMDAILGTSPGFTDRLSRILRDEMGLAYTVRANISGSAGLEPGTFWGFIGCSPKNRDKALEGMLRIIREMRAKPVSADELKDAQDYLTGNFVFDFETTQQLAGKLIDIERNKLGDDYVARYPELIRKVTIADVERVAKTYLDPDALARVEVGPVGKAK